MKHFTLHILAALLLLTSCEYKDLCYDHNHWVDVKVEFDWTEAPEALTRTDGGSSTGMGMTVLFYNIDNPEAEPIRYDLPGSNGGTVRLQPGTYKAVAYNYDTETILYRGMYMPEALEAYTRQSSIEEGTLMAFTRGSMPRAAGAEEEQVILEPDPLWGAVSEEFTLKMSGATRYKNSADTRSANAQTIYTLTMQPTTRVEEVDITITNVPNLQYTNQFGGSLSGLSPSVWMQSGIPGEGRVSQAFTCSVIDETTLQMRFRIFGHCPHFDEGYANAHLLTIYAILADGSKWYYTNDVTNQMHDSSSSTPTDDNHIYIELDDLPVPKPIVNGSGFQPTIDGWQGVEIEVGM